MKRLMSHHLEINLYQKVDLIWDPHMTCYMELKMTRLRDHHWEVHWGDKL